MAGHALKTVRLPQSKEALEAIVRSASQTISVPEGGFVIPAAFGILALALFASAVQDFLIGKVVSAVIFIILAACLAFLLIKTILRRKIPFMIIRPEGLETTVFKTYVPWQGITDFQINSAKSNAMNVAVGMEFVIDEKFLPQRNEKSRGGSYYDNKTKKLMISGYNFKLDLNRDKITHYIETYRTAALARLKLGTPL